jgi:restriction system protein
MEEEDPIVMPLKQRSGFAIGRVKGPYRYEKHGEEFLHVRSVEWVREVPRSTLGQDLQFSFGAFLTVFQVYRNEAERRIQAVLVGQPDPVLSGGLKPSSRAAETPVSGVAAEVGDTERVDLAQIAEDALRLRVGALFKGHRLSWLIGELLQADGYRTVISPPGADGGVDILAGRGSLGLDQPRIVVQVKSQDSPVDVAVFRELQGVLGHFNADQGLLVAWGGVTKALAKLAQQSFFQIRVWDSADVLRALQTNYDTLSEELRNDLPLKRIWVLAEEEPG